MHLYVTSDVDHPLYRFSLICNSDAFIYVCGVVRADMCTMYIDGICANECIESRPFRPISISFFV